MDFPPIEFPVNKCFTPHIIMDKPDIVITCTGESYCPQRRKDNKCHVGWYIRKEGCWMIKFMTHPLIRPDS